MDAAAGRGSSPRWSPSGEAATEPARRSCGFRPGRGCHDAIQAVYEVVKGRRPKRLWALDADLAGAFDRIAHGHVLAMLGTFPARGIVEQWLKAAVVEPSRQDQRRGRCSQGGVDPPLPVERRPAQGWRRPPESGMRRAACGALGCREGLPGNDQIRRRLSCPLPLPGRRHSMSRHSWPNWLAPRGLAFNEDEDAYRLPRGGLRLPGIQRPPLRHQAADQARQGGHQTIRERLRTELRSLWGSDPPTVIKKLNPIIRGWAAYYRTQVLSSEVFDALDQSLWELTFKWARFSHANKPTRWVVARYWGRLNKARQDRWVFGDRKSGAYLHRTSSGPTSSGTGSSSAWRPNRRPPPCRLLGEAAAQGAPADGPSRPACGFLGSPGRVAARSPGPCSCPTTTGREARASGSGR